MFVETYFLVGVGRTDDRLQRVAKIALGLSGGACGRKPGLENLHQSGYLQPTRSGD